MKIPEIFGNGAREVGTKTGKVAVLKKPLRIAVSLAGTAVMHFFNMPAFAQEVPVEITDFRPAVFDEPFTQCARTVGLEKFTDPSHTISVTVVRNAAGQPIDYINRNLGRQAGGCGVPPVCNPNKGIVPDLWIRLPGNMVGRLTIDRNNPGTAGQEWACGSERKFSYDEALPKLSSAPKYGNYPREPYRHEEIDASRPWKQERLCGSRVPAPQETEKRVSKNVVTGMLRALRSAY